MTDKTNDISSFVKGHLQEIEKEEKTVKLFKELNQKVRVVSKTVGEKYKVNKIYLFGSLLDVNLHSQIKNKICKWLLTTSYRLKFNIYY